MKKSLRVITLFTFMSLAACGGGSGYGDDPDPIVPPPAGPTPSEQLADDLVGLTLDEFYEASLAALIKRSPETIVWDALTGVFPLPTVSLDDISDSYTRETYAMVQVCLDALLSYDRAALDAEGQLNYDYHEWHFQDQVDHLEFIYYDFLATYSIFGVQNDTRTFFTDIHPLLTQQDAEEYITRLGQVSRKFSQLVDYLELQRQNGIVEPALTMQVAIDQVRGFAEGNAQFNSYYTSFVDKIAAIGSLSNAERQDLDDRALAAVSNSVIPGYQQLLQKLQSLLSSAPPSIGVGQYPRGNEFYAERLKHRTTTNLTAAEIHQLGLDELVRIHAEMRLIFDQLGYPQAQDATMQELFDLVATDGGIIPAADVLTTYESIIDAAELRLDEAFDIFPMADVVVLPDDFGGFYIAPSFDGSRPGAFYAGTTRDEPWYAMPSLTYHESVPGHHMQVAIAMEQDMPGFRRGARVTAFVEGWALYAERLAWELNWYENDPYANLGRLQYETLRAVRLVMDTGIHSLGWSFDQATQFNEDNVGWSTSASQGAAGRYSVWPGQATAYMIGMLQILQERQRAMDELGMLFDLKAFHRAVLSNGAVPMTLLQNVVDQYIAAAQAAP